MRLVAALFVLLVIMGGVYLFVMSGASEPSKLYIPGQPIQMVAAENFYGDIVKQLGGGKVIVKSILSNPNIDPHEYESTVQDAIAVADAQIVVENGYDYDQWMDKLIDASPNSQRAVINMHDIAPDQLPDNPHLWYATDNIMALANAISQALIAKDPADAGLFQANLNAFQASLAAINQRVADIKLNYAGVPVGLTETIYLYETGPMGLAVLTPFDFQKAIAEGNDPSAQSVDAANRELSEGQVKVLIYNSQTVTPITTHLQQLASDHNIPTVPISEMMPITSTYQSWILGEIEDLRGALHTATGR